ncbi:MAG: hypothetical protein Q9199_001666 [Rusavskia elegans]
MAELNTEDPPAVPPRQHTVVPMEDPIPRLREFFEGSLEKTLVTTLWSLLEPKEERSLQEFREDPVGEVERRLSALKEQLKILSADKKQVEDDIGSYKARLATTRKEAAEAKVRIVHRHYAVQGHKKLTGHNNPWFEGQKKFRDLLKSLGPEPLQRFGMRAKIFEFVNRDLISTRSFGVSKSEHNLKDFEEALVCSKAVSHSDLAEWRSRTIECGALLGEKSKGPGETCQDVLDFMLAKKQKGHIPDLGCEERQHCHGSD